MQIGQRVRVRLEDGSIVMSDVVAIGLRSPSSKGWRMVTVELPNFDKAYFPFQEKE